MYVYTQFELPNNIGELCFPDLATWVPHSPGLTQTYMLVVTSRDGTRTFGYCRRIQPEGDELCLPLAVCILTKHRARGLFAKVGMFVLHMICPHRKERKCQVAT